MSSPFTCTKISHSHGNTDKINDIVSLFVFSLCLFDVMEILPLFLCHSSSVQLCYSTDSLDSSVEPRLQPI